LILKAYFVRKTPDDEVVGIFIAASATALAALVDEHCDPTACEYALAGAGGIVVPTKTRAKWPFRADGPAVATGVERGVLTQQWEDDLDAKTTDLEWLPLKPAAERLLRTLRDKIK